MAEYIEKDKIVKWIWKQERLSKALTVMAIEVTPAADVAPVVHGRWEYCAEKWAIKSCYLCTACRYPRYEHYANKDFRYCPHCGAKMDGGDNDAKNNE